jgi:Reverse transcriptase (RNA-dependent DNA polymerase)
VAKGFSQIEGIDYDDIFSLVVRYESVCLIVALAASQHWHMSSVDVKTAFLYGELDEELFMEQPEGFKKKGQEHKVFHLKRALYGLKQVALQWWQALDKSMEAMGFKRLKSDSGVFVLMRSGRPEVIVIVYVDDAVFLGRQKHLVNNYKEHFMHTWECRDLGETKEFLKMRISRLKGVITLDQKDYLMIVLKRFNMHNVKEVSTPLPSGYNPVPNKLPVDEKLCTKYQQVIGLLLYLMLGTRPDIAFAVTKMAQFAANPSEEHLTKALYICKYLAGMMDYSLQYGLKQEGLYAYADADWASDLESR